MLAARGDGRGRGAAEVDRREHAAHLAGLVADVARERGRGGVSEAQLPLVVGAPALLVGAMAQVAGAAAHGAPAAQRALPLAGAGRRAGGRTFTSCLASTPSATVADNTTTAQVCSPPAEITDDASSIPACKRLRRGIQSGQTPRR